MNNNANLNKPLPANIAAYSINKEIRTEGRLTLIQQFLDKARERGESFIADEIISARLYIHELENEQIHEIVQLALNHLEYVDFIAWVKWKVINAIRDEYYTKATLILELCMGQVNFEVGDFSLFTPSLLRFLEEQAQKYTLSPFTQMNWHNGAGVEGFQKLLTIVGSPRIKKHIHDDNFYDKHDSTYTALGAMCKEGLLDGFFDRETLNLILARSLIQNLSKNPHKSVVADLANGFTSGRLLEIFATEAKLGNANYQAEAIATLLPYLPQA